MSPESNQTILGEILYQTELRHLQYRQKSVENTNDRIEQLKLQLQDESINLQNSVDKLEELEKGYTEMS